jgi:ABC-type multidrug transport system ATPase subunit
VYTTWWCGLRTDTILTWAATDRNYLPASGSASGSPGRSMVDPFLVVLDEPNSNLDAEGEAALDTAIAAIRARGGIVALVAHRPAALRHVNKVLVLQNGRMAAFGDRDAVLGEIIQSPRPGSIDAPTYVGPSSANGKTVSAAP